MLTEMNPEIKKEWDNFLKYINERHNLVYDWIPDYYSIRLWEEYKKEKKNGQKITS